MLDWWALTISGVLLLTFCIVVLLSVVWIIVNIRAQLRECPERTVWGALLGYETPSTYDYTTCIHLGPVRNMGDEPARDPAHREFQGFELASKPETSGRHSLKESQGQHSPNSTPPQLDDHVDLHDDASDSVPEGAVQEVRDTSNRDDNSSYQTPTLRVDTPMRTKRQKRSKRPKRAKDLRPMSLIEEGSEGVIEEEAAASESDQEENETSTSSRASTGRQLTFQ
jgi:hypothetical protein